MATFLLQTVFNSLLRFHGMEQPQDLENITTIIINILITVMEVVVVIPKLLDLTVVEMWSKTKNCLQSKKCHHNNNQKYSSSKLISRNLICKNHILMGNCLKMNHPNLQLQPKYLILYLFQIFLSKCQHRKC